MTPILLATIPPLLTLDGPGLALSVVCVVVGAVGLVVAWRRGKR